MVDDYDAKKEACDQAMEGCPPPPDTVDCTVKSSALVNKSEHCDTVQHNFEMKYCNYAQQVEETWDNYTICYTTNLATLNTAETVQHTELPERQQQWRAIQRVNCLLDVMLKDSPDMATELQACIDTSYDHTGLTISYPTDDSDFPPLQTCDTLMWEPGASGFNSNFYKNASLMSDSLTETHGCVGRLGLSHCKMRH